MVDVCLVTGASSSVGRATLAYMSTLGYRVGYLVDSQAALTDTSAAIPQAVGITAVESQDIGPALLNLIERLGLPRVLVLCDEAYMSAPVVETSPAILDALMERILARRLEAVRTLTPYLATVGEGRVINLIHRDWLGWSQVVAFSSVNGALVSFTRSLAWELAKQHILVNGVVVGVVCSPGETEFHGRPVDTWLVTQPIRRPASPVDIAKAIAFLADRRSRFISGQILYLDGGRSIYSSLTA